MAADVYMRVVPGGLMASNAAEASKLEDLVGKEVRCVVSQPRNIGFHKKYFAMLKVGYDMADTPFNMEQFRLYVQAGAGWCEFLQGHDGNLVAVPKSISFTSMDQFEFQVLYSDVLNFICEQWALDYDQIERIVEFL